MFAPQNTLPFVPDARFDLTKAQADIAFDCLNKALEKEADDLLAYLIHAVVLFFVARDQQAFAAVYRQPGFTALVEKKPIRQLPTQVQLTAVLKSLGADEAMLALAGSFSDAALGVAALKAFRDELLQNGVPELVPDAQAELCRDALGGWKRLEALAFGG